MNLVVFILEAIDITDAVQYRISSFNSYRLFKLWVILLLPLLILIRHRHLVVHEVIYFLQFDQWLLHLLKIRYHFGKLLWISSRFSFTIITRILRRYPSQHIKHFPINISSLLWIALDWLFLQKTLVWLENLAERWFLDVHASVGWFEWCCCWCRRCCFLFLWLLGWINLRELTLCFLNRSVLLIL